MDSGSLVSLTVVGQRETEIEAVLVEESCHLCVTSDHCLGQRRREKY